ncbi:carboxypeptidase regulatory-like domain-containing protein [Acinetobacter lwoffii]|uniref:carboxypeptidase regulatory-like domain-containing protein n=1 Tax=Acinetobacter lwoffii TaxID=28090 RepID=UPI00209B3ACD|nr:carboxypeptidase regulatory-like domain-containing protein [Acinetobacter lwoffii]MCO8092632.1 carboxypeptidase regulatory-like domain-containing protein [Acinetobacter lwoffii]
MNVSINVTAVQYYANEANLSFLKGLSIKGVVKEQNVPIPCRLRLYEKLSGRLVMETITDNSGNYLFDHLNKASFFIVAHHPAGEFNAVIQDNVEPK